MGLPNTDAFFSSLGVTPSFSECSISVGDSEMLHSFYTTARTEAEPRK